MLNSIINQYLQETFQNYIKSNENIERFIKGEKVYISNLILPMASTKRNVTRIMNKGWVIVEGDRSGNINTIQLRMDIFKVLNVFQYSTRAEMLKKLTDLTQAYLSDDIRKGYQEIVEYIQPSLWAMRCEEVPSFIMTHPSHIVFTTQSDFFDNASEDMELIANISKVLQGRLMFSQNDDGSYQYTLIMRDAKQMEHAHHVKELKKELRNVLYKITDDKVINTYFKERRVRQEANNSKARKIEPPANNFKARKIEPPANNFKAQPSMSYADSLINKSIETWEKDPNGCLKEHLNNDDHSNDIKTEKNKT